MYSLTEEQTSWLDRHVLSGLDSATLTRNVDLWHGFHDDFPTLNNTQALWMSLTKEGAEYYRDLGRNGRGGVLHFRPLGEINLIPSDIGVFGFFKEFDEGWGIDHEHFSRRLHAWATKRNLSGVVDSSGDVVLFRAADLVQEIY